MILRCRCSLAGRAVRAGCCPRWLITRIFAGAFTCTFTHPRTALTCETQDRVCFRCCNAWVCGRRRHDILERRWCWKRFFVQIPFLTIR